MDKNFHQKIMDVLELARWAPSGDNGQPWRFELSGNNMLRIHLSHQADNVYEFGNGCPVWISAGALVETIALGAASRNLSIRIVKVVEFKDGAGEIVISFAEDFDAVPDPLADFIVSRSVNRRAYSLKDISDDVKRDLEKSMAGSGFEVTWFSSLPEKWRITRLNCLATHIRLSIREAYEVHRKMIDWENEQSEEQMPAKSLGMSPLTFAITRWAIKSWDRVLFLSRYLGGAFLPSLEMDIIPGIFCARHFVLSPLSLNVQEGPEQWIALGRSVQRLWLCAEKNGLSLQPGMAPVVFASHSRGGTVFTNDIVALRRAGQLNSLMAEIFSQPGKMVLFAGRLGYPREGGERKFIRSIRRPLAASLYRG